MEQKEEFVKTKEETTSEEITISEKKEQKNDHKRVSSISSDYEKEETEVLGIFEVIFQYSPLNEDELSLTKGEILELIGKPELKWWMGRRKKKLDNGKNVGLFPTTFVKEIFYENKRLKKTKEEEEEEKRDDEFFKDLEYIEKGDGSIYYYKSILKDKYEIFRMI